MLVNCPADFRRRDILFARSGAAAIIRRAISSIRLELRAAQACAALHREKRLARASPNGRIGGKIQADNGHLEGSGQMNGKRVVRNQKVQSGYVFTQVLEALPGYECTAASAEFPDQLFGDLLRRCGFGPRLTAIHDDIPARIAQDTPAYLYPVPGVPALHLLAGASK